MARSEEIRLYPKVRSWLSEYLKQKYPRKRVSPFVATHSRSLSRVIADADLHNYFPESSCWDVHIDVVAVIQSRKRYDLAFVEVKMKPIALKDIGQLLVYCRVCKPREAFLLSPQGVSSDLDKLLRDFGRQDILRYKSGVIKIATWNVDYNVVDWNSLIPPGDFQSA